MSRTERRPDDDQSSDSGPIQPPHTDDSEPASNAEQTLSPGGQANGDEPDDDADPEVAERFAREAERRSVGRG